MLHKAIQVRLYPTQNQQIQVVTTLGCARWWWNSGLNKSIEVDKTTRKKLGCSRLNTLFLALKKSDGSASLDECYSQFVPANAYINRCLQFFLIHGLGLLNSIFRIKNCYLSIVKHPILEIKMSKFSAMREYQNPKYID
ncbi:helix-turn-helix domain-containing protein [Microcoleus sp. MOSTC5]|uniref:helix-turn-helix domain-containing protein n=1 Tax=Microcoleus sp. MOSTC5 TaxID=3055378 RepID=UPI002FD255E8